MKRGNEFLVGLVLLVGLAVVVAGALWLSEANIGRRESLHVSRFRTVGGRSGTVELCRPQNRLDFGPSGQSKTVVLEACRWSGPPKYVRDCVFGLVDIISSPNQA